MTQFEYAAIFYGIVVGIAITNILTSVHILLEAGSRVRWHWMAPALAVTAMVGTLGQFWLWWVGRDERVGHMTFLTFLPSVLAVTLLYLACAATLPDSVPESGIDLREYYFSNRRRIWDLIAAFLLLKAAQNIWIMTRVNFDVQQFGVMAPLLLAPLASGTMAATMVFVRAPWWHAVGIILLLASMIVAFGPMQL